MASPTHSQLVGYNGVVASNGNDKMVDMLQQNLENIDSGKPLTAGKLVLRYPSTRYSHSSGISTQGISSGPLRQS